MQSILDQGDPIAFLRLTPDEQVDVVETVKRVSAASSEAAMLLAA
jgi:hypothetical protein